MKTLLISLLTLFFSANILADDVKKLDNDKYSQVNVTKKKDKTGTTLEFNVKIADGIKYNFDGPWKLKSKTDGKENKTLGTSDFQKSQNYTLQVPSEAKAVEYRLTAFVCTKDKTRCFREVHQDTVKL